MWPFTSPPKVYTGRLVTALGARIQLGIAGNGAVLGKSVYAEVDSRALVWLGQQARNALFADGVPAWAPDAACTLFSAAFVAKANALFAKQAFHDPIAKNVCALAVFDVWFHPDNVAPGTDHAIGGALSEQGFQTIDVQAPNALRPMSDTERLSIKQLRLL